MKRFALRLLAAAVLLPGAGATARAERVLHWGRTRVLPRSQVDYTLHRTYLHGWIDRPLFHDRSTFEPEQTRWTQASYRRVIDSALPYGIDGMAFITRSRSQVAGYLQTIDFHDELAPSGFAILPEFAGADAVEEYSRILERTLASPRALRHNGRVLVSSYHADSSSPEAWANTLAELRDRHGDVFLFLPQLRELSLKWGRDFRASGGRLPEATVARHRQRMREYLDVSDGLHLVGMMSQRDPVRFNTFARDAFEALIEVGRGVLAESPYADRFFALGIWQGHYNDVQGVLALNEDGTRTLRAGLEAALAARPDLVILTEWDEANENTSYQPTVYSSFSTQRIVRHYMRRLRGDPPAPNPGDDTTLPNLVLSHRRWIKAGEAIEIELLHVPDSASSEEATVRLQLSDLDGAVVAAFPPTVFRSDELREERFVIPSEDLWPNRMLVPSLEIETAAGETRNVQDGLHPIALHATRTFDYKWVRQPLRDLLRPVEAQFSVRRLPETTPDTVAGAVRVEGRFHCDEDIATVEVISDGTVLYAVDPAEEHGQEEEHLLFKLLFASVFRPFRGGYETLEGTLRIEGALAEIRPDKQDRQKPEEDRAFLVNPDGTVTISLSTGMLGFVSKGVYLVVPQDRLEEAVLHLDTNVFRTRVPLSEAARLGLIAETAEDGVVLVLERYTKLPAHPLHLATRDVRFSAVLYPETAEAALHMRVIGTSGRIYRSPAVLPLAEDTGPSVQIPVYSAVHGRRIHVTADRARVPVVAYRFDPAHGVLLATPAGRPFFGMLGAGPPLATGIGGGYQETTGNIFGEYLRRGNYPSEARATAPRWVPIEEGHALEFDGRANLLSLPREALPRGGFTLAFEIMPLEQKACTLFVHHGQYTGMFRLDLDGEGRFSGTFTDWNLGAETFQTDLAVPANEWSRVRIRYDLETFVFEVGDREERFTPANPRPWFYPMPSAFGGFGSGTGYFRGLLRSLRIEHYSEP